MVIALSLGEIPEEVKEKIDNDWKKQIEGKLTKEERGELKKLEEENLKTIEEVYKSLKDDEEVQKWIEKIKSHEWVRVIGGENEK